ncbi:SMI1/KNR4 family protein [Fibrella arboris]|uniref:SMI1/KNR4 family protein n=1 Tax=Fibrella arboris TaxID=3242486 RepID=UPI003520BD01
MNLGEIYVELIKQLIPNQKEQLLAGCTIEQILDLEQKLGFVLPDSYKSILRFCNGENWQANSANLFGMHMLSIDEVLWEYEDKISNEFEEDVEVTQPALVQAQKLRMKRIPFACDGGGGLFVY